MSYNISEKDGYDIYFYLLRMGKALSSGFLSWFLSPRKNTMSKQLIEILGRRGRRGERYSILRLTSHSRWISLTPICFVTHFSAIFRQCGPLMWLTDQPCIWLTDGPADCLSVFLSFCLSDWIAGRLVFKLADRLTDWLDERLTDLLTDWLIDWLTACLFDWLKDRGRNEIVNSPSSLTKIS